jgi:hypothetical protein
MISSLVLVVVVMYFHGKPFPAATYLGYILGEEALTSLV